MLIFRSSWLVSFLFFSSPISYLFSLPRTLYFFFFLNDPAPPEISPLPLPDALPIPPQGDVHELHAAADPQPRQVPPAGLRDQGDLRIGALLAHDLEGKALALAVPAGVEVGPAPGPPHPGPTGHRGAAGGVPRGDGQGGRDGPGRPTGRPVPDSGQEPCA